MLREVECFFYGSLEEALVVPSPLDRIETKIEEHGKRLAALEGADALGVLHNKHIDNRFDRIERRQDQDKTEIKTEIKEAMAGVHFWGRWLIATVGGSVLATALGFLFSNGGFRGVTG